MISVVSEECPETLIPSFCGEGTVWDIATSTCISANTADINNDGCVQLNDLLDLLTAYGDCGAEGQRGNAVIRSNTKATITRQCKSASSAGLLRI